MPEPILVGPLLFGADRQVADYVRQRIPRMEKPFENCTTIGVVRRGRFLGGLVFHNVCEYRGRIYSVEMSGAFDDPSWCYPATLRQLFRYPFAQLECVRLTTICAKKNTRARKLDKWLGFREEGCIRKGWDGSDDAIVMGMLREECRWLQGIDGRLP